MPTDHLEMHAEPRRPTSTIWSLADVVDEVYNVLHPAVTRSTVVATVRRCKRELEIVHAPARPEHVQRMAIERLRPPRIGTYRASRRHTPRTARPPDSAATPSVAPEQRTSECP